VMTLAPFALEIVGRHAAVAVPKAAGAVAGRVSGDYRRVCSPGGGGRGRGLRFRRLSPCLQPGWRRWPLEGPARRGAVRRALAMAAMTAAVAVPKAAVAVAGCVSGDYRCVCSLGGGGPGRGLRFRRLSLCLQPGWRSLGARAPREAAARNRIASMRRSTTSPYRSTLEATPQLADPLGQSLGRMRHPMPLHDRRPWWSHEPRRAATGRPKRLTDSGRVVALSGLRGPCTFAAPRSTGTHHGV
jgi:hypothetical protein